MAVELAFCHGETVDSVHAAVSKHRILADKAHVRLTGIAVLPIHLIDALREDDERPTFGDRVKDIVDRFRASWVGTDLRDIDNAVKRLCILARIESGRDDLVG
ncbi:hypothetical protein [Halegenticoccus tardaugens]|uniref:hypothetical protein n=1 Tax=Halegenticoccus tardaugens TaxID=2071624 RepID=UPI00100C21BB|nr:hypothetical protein [Halegenticoccus tardaugens]